MNRPIYSGFRYEMVGATGFEPATPCAQGRCATRLRYAPTLKTFDFTAVPPASQLPSSLSPLGALIAASPDEVRVLMFRDRDAIPIEVNAV